MTLIELAREAGLTETDLEALEIAEPTETPDPPYDPAEWDEAFGDAYHRAEASQPETFLPTVSA